MNKRNIFVAVAVTLASAALLYGTVGLPASAGPDSQSGAAHTESSICTDNFTKGSGNSLITWCATGNGNVAQLAFKTVEQIRVGAFVEGYILCVGGVLKAYDIADLGESGWQAPTRTQPGGPNTLPLTITRKTTDNTIQLAQTYAFTTDSVSVTATFTNLTGATIANVKYLRNADLDAAGTTVNSFSRSQDGIKATVDGSVGILMGNASYGQARTYSAQTFPGAPACSPASNVTPEAGVDDTAYESFALNNLLPGTPKSSVVVYRRV
jgi:hypothetical protein